MTVAVGHPECLQQVVLANVHKQLDLPVSVFILCCFLLLYSCPDVFNQNALLSLIQQSGQVIDTLFCIFQITR